MRLSHTQPPALAGFLRHRGWNQVEQMDVNIEFVTHLLNGKRWNRLRTDWKAAGTPRQEGSAQGGRRRVRLLVKLP